MRSSQLRLLSWSSLVFVLVCVFGLPALVLAEPRVVVGNFSGPSAKKVRAAVVSVLKDEHIVLVPSWKARHTAKRSGAELDSESGRVRVAKRLGLQGFVEGRTRSVRRRIEIDIRFYRGSDGMQAAAFKATVRKWTIRRELNQNLWDAIGAALVNQGEVASPRERRVQRSSPVATTEPRAPQRQDHWQRGAVDDELPPGIAPSRELAQARDDDSDNEALALEAQTDQGEASTDFPSAFDLAVGARVGTRSFGYNDSLPGLRGYSLLPSPSLSLHGHWYPAAHFDAGVAAHVGIDVRADVLVGVSSERKDGQKFATNSHRLGLGLRGRIPLNDLELGIIGGYGQHSFSLANNGAVTPDIPNINYSFIRMGADARYQFNASFAVQLQAAFLYGLSLGQISSAAWFPHARGNGLEAELSFQLAMTRMLSFELAAGMQRYFMSLNPSADDPAVRGTMRVAGGALDKYYSSRLGVIIRP